MGYKFVDSNAERQTGFYDHQGSLRDSQRCSTAKAYLVPAENRTNLDILPNAMATKIVIRNRQATGVRFDFRGRIYEVKARKEVILSAGAMRTPQLLMLSGVGPKEELRRLRIPIKADLPVGRNLQDHPTTFQLYLLNPHIPTYPEKLSNPDNILQYMRNRTGPLASSSGISLMAFLKGEERYPKVDFPNYELYLGEIASAFIKNNLGLKPQVYRKLYGPYENEPLLQCMTSVLQPRSRGTITLKSKNPYDPPIIDPNYISDPKDIDDLVQGMKTCQRIATSGPLQKKGVRLMRTLIPGCEKYAYDEDRYFRCQARSILISLHHASGTSKMGDPWDPTTVVDPQLRVKNIKGLRVIDASVMPIIPSGNTNIPTIVVAEKASDILKESIKCYKNNEKDDDAPIEFMDWSDEEESGKPRKEWYSSADTETLEDENSWKNTNDDEESWKPKQEWDSSDDAESIEVEKLWGNTKEWEKPKHKENIWVEEKKIVPKKMRDESVESWSKKLKVPLGDLWMSPVKTSWSEDEEDSTGSYKNTQPLNGFWTTIGKLPLKYDFKKTENLNPSEFYSDNHSKQSSPYSWYKEQTDRILRNIKQPDYPEKEEDDSYTSWKESDNYQSSKGVDELVKLADEVYQN